ncbi:signal peptidase I [Lacrimispora sphenoides]|uniref:Signal peptidase I n=1 Tax=Lacrimispora sphenoides JCM 1415 TaxID=1297793 RepID=A0ABY1CBA8_9FIRM|nr:signal peptidase I [Lacrimispora sphenoides]SET88256.1 signal peptidase I [[Clostridium] sphenoides JCM 1415]SUY52039.1 signal peptidase LepB [Lacrimispora sphenoides]
MSELQKHGENKAAEKNYEFPAEPSLGKEIVFLLAKIAAIILAFLLVFTFLFGLCRNSDASMVPSVKDGDLVMFYRLDKSYVAQDTLVLEFKGKKQVRRVIATAGDTVDITEDGLLINGALQQEAEIYTPTQRYEDGVEFPLTVREGEVFVLGDSRENSTDSRIYGAVRVKDTLGKVMTILRRRNI